MDFRRVLQSVVHAFDRNRVRYALIGGFALGPHGAPRSTTDLDFLAHRDDLEIIHNLLDDLRYARVFFSENASHYRSPDSEWGRIDFIHAFRRVSLGMLSRAALREACEGAVSLPVLEVEDIIGLKAQAIGNNPNRADIDWPDIHRLLRLHSPRIDWNRLEEYFELLEMSEAFSKLKSEYTC